MSVKVKPRSKLNFGHSLTTSKLKKEFKLKSPSHRKANIHVKHLKGGKNPFNDLLKQFEKPVKSQEKGNMEEEDTDRSIFQSGRDRVMPLPKKKTKVGSIFRSKNDTE